MKKAKTERITMTHGAGGEVMASLIKRYVLKHLGGSQAEVPLEALDDAAAIENWVLKSDSHAVKPLFFPGGNIGTLAVAGTVNDIAVLGAEPVALTCGLILEEGLPVPELDAILKSMGKASLEARVPVITGDTKVVEKNGVGGCIINTSGIGRRNPALEHNLKVVKAHHPHLASRWVLDANLQPGDKIVLSGTIGDHGLAVLSAQEGLRFGSNILSDVKPLNKLIQKMLQNVGGVTAMKDPTRGGLSNALNEWSQKAGVGILVQEEKIPKRRDVQVACEMLGIDILEVGNEGKIIVGVTPENAPELLEFLKATKEGKDAEIIGEATTRYAHVVMQTTIGGKRILTPPIGDPIPRIC